MKMMLPKLNVSAEYFLRACSYIKIENPHKQNEVSYARSTDPGRFYPRFHVYLEESPKGATLNIHLDAKKPSYEGTTAHSGEYEGLIVEKEAERIQNIALRFSPKPPDQQLGFLKKKPWWHRLFGN